MSFGGNTCPYMETGYLIGTLLPDMLLNWPYKGQQLETQTYSGVLLFIELSGITSLCAKYLTGTTAIQKFTATVNGCLGAIIEIIHFYGGDVIKFSGEMILIYWNVDKNTTTMTKMLHNVIQCSLFIQETVGKFETDIEQLVLHVVLTISCGDLEMALLGNNNQRFFVTIGLPVFELRIFDRLSSFTGVMLSATAWKNCARERYEHTYMIGGHVKISAVIYKKTDYKIKEKLEEQNLKLAKLCTSHVIYSKQLRRRRDDDEEIVNKPMFKSFLSQLPMRKSIKTLSEETVKTYLKQFIIDPVLEQIAQQQPLENLSEIFQATILIVNVWYNKISYTDVITLANESLLIALEKIESGRGWVNKVTLIDEDILFVIVFGLDSTPDHPVTYHALKSAYAMHTEISRLNNVSSVSIGVATGLAFWGVIGHPLRRGAVTLGNPLHTAIRIMIANEGIVACDQLTYKLSKFPSCYFNLQKSKSLRGLHHLGNIYQYNELFKSTPIVSLSKLPLLGRDADLNLSVNVLNKAIADIDHLSIIFVGESKIGKTRLITEIFKIALSKSIITASICGSTRRTAKPYLAVFQIYEQLHDAQERIKVDLMASTDLGMSKMLRKSPSDYWTFKDLLSIDLLPKHYIENIETFREERILDLYKRLLENIRCCLIIIDDLECIDQQSSKILFRLLDDPVITIIATVMDDEECPTIIKDFLVHPLVLRHNVEGISLHLVAALACQLLKVYGLPQELNELLQNTSEGRPGWIQNCLFRLINIGEIKIVPLTEDHENDPKFVFPDLNILTVPTTAANKDNDFPQEKLVIVLDSRFNTSNLKKTLNQITLELFYSFTPFQQYLLQVASVIGNIFTSVMLKKLMQETPVILFVQAIKRMFNEQVLECEVKRAMQQQKAQNINSELDSLICFCDFEQNSLETRLSTRYNIPKYAFCKHLHFSNDNVRITAYSLLTNDEKIALHRQIIGILEHEPTICHNCTEATTIFNIPKYSDFISALKQYEKDDHELQLRVSKHSTTQKVDQFEELKAAIKEQIGEKNPPKNDDVTLNAKQTWNPQNCFCGTILARIYYQLIKHSSFAETVEKHIYFLVQLATVLITINQYSASIRYLKKASELCLEDEYAPNNIQERPKLFLLFRRIMFCRAHCLIGQASLELNQLNAAEIHLSIVLRQHNIPLISTNFNLLTLLCYPSCYKWFKKKYPASFLVKKSPIKLELGRCLFLYSKLEMRKHDFYAASLCATKSVFILENNKANYYVLIEAYNNAMYTNLFTGEKEKFKSLEKWAKETIYERNLDNDTMQLYAIGKFLYIVAYARILEGKLKEGVCIAYRALEINNQIHSRNYTIRIIRILISNLKSMRRIEEMASLVEYLNSMRESSRYDEASIWYHALCIEIYLDTGFAIEKMKVCRHFAQKYFFDKEIKSLQFMDFEKFLIVCLILFNCRMGNWAEALKWRGVLTMNKHDLTPFFISIVLRYIECILLLLVNEYNQNIRSPLIPRFKQKIKKLFKDLVPIVKIWEVYQPRYYHMKAYYRRIQGKRYKSSVFLQMAEQISIKHNNVIECLWTRTSRETWTQGRDLNNRADVKSMQNEAYRFTRQDWRYILYPLPLPAHCTAQ